MSTKLLRKLIWACERRMTKMNGSDPSFIVFLHSTIARLEIKLNSIETDLRWRLSNLKSAPLDAWKCQHLDTCQHVARQQRERCQDVTMYAAPRGTSILSPHATHVRRLLFSIIKSTGSHKWQQTFEQQKGSQVWLTAGDLWSSATLFINLLRSPLWQITINNVTCLLSSRASVKFMISRKISNHNHNRNLLV